MAALLESSWLAVSFSSFSFAVFLVSVCLAPRLINSTIRRKPETSEAGQSELQRPSIWLGACCVIGSRVYPVVSVVVILSGSE